MISSKFIHSLDTIEMSIIQAKRKNRKKHVPSADLSLAFEGVYTCCTSSYFPYFKWPIFNSIVCFQARKFGRDFGWAWNNNLIEWSQNSIECYWFLFSFRFVSFRIYLHLRVANWVWRMRNWLKQYSVMT